MSVLEDATGALVTLPVAAAVTFAAVNLFKLVATCAAPAFAKGGQAQQVAQQSCAFIKPCVSIARCGVVLRGAGSSSHTTARFPQGARDRARPAVERQGLPRCGAGARGPAAPLPRARPHRAPHRPHGALPRARPLRAEIVVLVAVLIALTGCGRLLARTPPKPKKDAAAKHD